MRRPAILFALLLLSPAVVRPAAAAPSEATWVKQAPWPTDENVNGVDMLDANEGWAVGGSVIGGAAPSGEGFVLHTTDGGATWAHQDPGTTEPLHGVKFLDALHGWAVGNVALWTDDGGLTWNESPSVVGGASGVDFVDLNRGWAASNGGVILRTVDGGRTWTWMATDTIETLKDVDFVDASNGWIVGVNGTILHTTNGGQTWTEQPSVATYLDGVEFFNAKEGWVAGGNTILRTTNGGATWQPRPAPPEAWAHSLSFADPMHGWIAGSNVAATTDGGRTWTMQDIANPNRLWGVDAVDGSNAVIVGQVGGLFTTADGGATWVNRLNGSAETTFGIDANDSLHAWAAGDSGDTAYTVDGGATWVRVPLGDQYGHLDAVDFLPDNLTGWVVGSNFFTQGEIYRSDDGGATWSHQFTGGEGTLLYGVAAITRKIAVAVGSGARIWRTTNGGQSWTSVFHPPSSGWADVEFRGRIGYAAGNNSGLLRSNDRGATWRDVSPPFVGDPPLEGVSFADRMNGWVVGFYGTVGRTTDGGRTWTKKIVPGAEDATFTSVSAVGPTTAWISRWDGVLYRTTDSGATWTREVLPGGPSISMTVAFLTAAQGWAGGAVGVWRRSA